MVTGFIAPSLTFIVFCFVLLQILRQQGRILLRLDELELGNSGHSINRVPGLVPGLAIGTAVEDFQLPGLTGKTVALSDFRGRRVLLIYWSVDCGFCDMVAADLARLQAQLQENNTEIVLVAYGDAESNRKLAAEHGLSCTILLLKDSPAQKSLENVAFDNCGTPSAYLLDDQGRVAQPLAAGATPVIALAREAAKVADAAEVKPRAFRKLPLSASHIEREGLKAGAPAPHFSLPDIHGATVSIDQFHGRKLLLVFTDPQCGPCDELAPQLVRLHSRHGNNGLALVMVGRGDTEQNKRKAKEHGIVFPVVLQERWKVSRQYGIFATPVAFLIGKNGVIMRNVATGPDQIMTLAREGLASS